MVFVVLFSFEMTSNSQTNDTSNEILTDSTDSTDSIDSNEPNDDEPNDEDDEPSSTYEDLWQTLLTGLMLCLFVLVIGLFVYLLCAVNVPGTVNTPKYATSSVAPLAVVSGGAKLPQTSTSSKSWSVGRVLVLVLGILAGICAFLYVMFLFVLPLLFRCWTWTHYLAVFATFRESDINEHSKHHSKCLRNFVLTNEEDFDSNNESIQLGVWHIPPREDKLSQAHHNKTPSTKPGSPSMYSFDKNDLVVLYAHGACATRGEYARIKLYKRLSNELRYHVISFDYRGFADSSDVLPTAGGLVRDTKVLYRWILSQGVPPEQIVLWGHSLGTAVLIQMLSSAPNSVPTPRCAILEAPLTNISEAIESNSIAKFFKPLPWFKCCFVTPIVTNPDLNFNSLNLLPKVNCPLLIFHSTDDDVIPIRQGMALYLKARKVQPSSVKHKTQIHKYDQAELKLNHNFIYKAPDLMDKVKDFVDKLHYRQTD